MYHDFPHNFTSKAQAIESVPHLRLDVYHVDDELSLDYYQELIHHQDDTALTER